MIGIEAVGIVVGATGSFEGSLGFSVSGEVFAVEVGNVQGGATGEEKEKQGATDHAPYSGNAR